MRYLGKLSEILVLLNACSESTEVNKVSFTGSVATGRRIGLCAMKNLKPATLELGGKSPVIVFADAVESEEDLEKTVEWIMVRIIKLTSANAISLCREEYPSS